MSVTAALVRISLARRVVLIPTVVLVLIVGVLISVIALMPTNPGIDPMLRAGVPTLAGLSLIPFFVGLRIVVAESIAPRLDQFRALMDLGVPRRRVASYLRLEAVALATASTLVGTLLAPLALRAIVAVVFVEYTLVLPDALWPSPLGGLLTWVIMLVFVLLAVQAALPRLDPRPARARTGRRPRGLWSAGFAFGLVATGLTVALLVYVAATPWNDMAAWVPWVTPLGVAASCTFTIVALARVVDAVAVRAAGWTWLPVAMRQVRLRPPGGIAAMMTLLMAYPLAMYANFNQLAIASFELSAPHLTTAPVVVAADRTMLSASAARDLCGRLGDTCLGELAWSSMGRKDGHLVPPADGTLVWVLHPSTPAVRDRLVADPTITFADSGFRNFLHPAWHAVVDTPYDPVFGALVAVPDGFDAGSLGAGYAVVPAQEWLRHDAPTRLLVGATGSNNKEIIPMFVFLLLGAASVVFGVTTVRQNHLVAAVDDLGALGVGPGRRGLVRTLVNVTPSLFAIAGAYLTCVAAASVVPTVLSGRATLVWTPTVPAVVAVTLGGVAVLAALLPTVVPTHRRHG